MTHKYVVQLEVVVNKTELVHDLDAFYLEIEKFFVSYSSFNFYLFAYQN